MWDLPFAEFIALIGSSHSILQVSHVNPDADTLGSSLALRQALTRLGKQVTTVCADPPVENYRFLPGIQYIEKAFEPRLYDLIITIDCADLTKMTGFYKEHEAFFTTTPLINIDHHPSNSRFGTVAMVAPKAASVGEIMVHVLDAIKAPIDRDMATCLLAALYYDTGSFQHSNTTSDVMHIASRLKRYGANHENIAYYLFQKKSFPLLALWGLALQKLKVDKDRGIAWVFVSEEDLARTGTGSKELEGLIALIHGIPEVKMTIILSERGNAVVKGSIRTSNGTDAAYYAGLFGGGGHHKAAGFSAPLEKSPSLPITEPAHDRLPAA